VFISGDTSSTCPGYVYRGDAALLPKNPWQSVTCGGANGTSPHADSRALAFDAAGNLLEANDGGLFRLMNPDNPGARKWVSVVGDIRVTELHSVAYDPLSKIVFGGAQDVGSPVQSAPRSFVWNDLEQGDGGVVEVDADQSAHKGQTLRYTSQVFLCYFMRTAWDASNNLVGSAPVGLNIVSGPGAGQTLLQFGAPPVANPCTSNPNLQFYNPYALNAVNRNRMLIGTNDIYESFDNGDTLHNLFSTGQFIGANNNFGRPIAYGALGARSFFVSPPDVFYVGAGNLILHRRLRGGAITTLANYPGGGVRTIVMNPFNFWQVYVLDGDNRIWGSAKEGVSWTELTANLAALTSKIGTIEVVARDATVKNTVLLAGGIGVFQMRSPTGAGQWQVVPAGSPVAPFPNALVQDLRYDPADDVLVAALLGRGAWTLSGFFQGKTAAVPKPVPAAKTPAPYNLNVPALPPISF
jgi:hypothetical protein